MNVETHAGWDAFAALEHDWNEVLCASRANSIFLRWEWIEAWRRIVSRDSVQPVITVVRDDSGALVGIGPFYVTSGRLLGTVSYRVLRTLGDHESGAEYQDWIVRQDVEQEAAAAIATALRGLKCWDCAWMPYVANWTGAADRVLGAAHDSQLLSMDRTMTFSALALPSDHSEYLASLSGNARSMLKRRTLQVKKLPGFAFTQCELEEQRAGYLAALFDLHERRWQAAGLPGSFVRRPLMADFSREFSRVALERGWLRLFGIQSEGVFKAVQFGYVYEGTFYQMQEGFDPEAPDGIGNVLRSLVIEACIAENVHTYDFLGGFTEHKRRWSAAPRVGRQLLIGRNTLKNRPLFGAGIWPTGRYLQLDAIRGWEGSPDEPLQT
jgi:CelD/BcsL family acetyltransferase involved in cellulose biosynthesis